MGSRATSQLWAVPTGAPIGPEMKHDSVFIWATTFDPEGKRVLAAGNDGTAWLWDVATGTRKVGPFRHLDAVMRRRLQPRWPVLRHRLRRRHGLRLGSGDPG